MFPALNAFRAVEASVMIESWIRSSLTELALRHFVFLVSVIDASCFHAESLNGPVGHDVLRLRPLVAVLRHRRLVDGQERVVRHLLDEPRLRRGQRDLEAVLPDRLDPDLVLQRVAVRLARVAAVVGLGALDPVELVRVVRTELRRDRPQPREHVVRGGDRLAVRPLHGRVQLDVDDLALDRPAGGRARKRLQLRRGAELHERLHEVQDDVGRRRVGCETRVERRRLSADRLAERLGLGTRCSDRRARDGNGDERGGTCPPCPSLGLSHSFPP